MAGDGWWLWWIWRFTEVFTGRIASVFVFSRNTMRMLMGYVYSAYLLWLHFRMVDNWSITDLITVGFTHGGHVLKVHRTWIGWWCWSEKHSPGIPQEFPRETIIWPLMIETCRNPGSPLVAIRRKFRSQTSDNMERWKAEQGRGREKRKIRREKIRRERVRRKKI